MAWDCLHSVPLNDTAAVDWLESLKPYVAWQRTQSYLKNPPPDYVHASVDVYTRIDEIIAKVDNYTNEYELELAIYSIFQDCHDEHFKYYPTLVTDVFAFRRPFSIVSLSSVGQKLPKPYIYEDIIYSSQNMSFKPSALVAINGMDATHSLELMSRYGSGHDLDSLYNSVMHQASRVAAEGGTAGGHGIFFGDSFGLAVYTGFYTALTFENGTSTLNFNYALPMKDFKQVESGQDIYDMYLDTNDRKVKGRALSQSKALDDYTNTPFPSLSKQNLSNAFQGFYLASPQYADIAVLSVQAFHVDSLSDDKFSALAQQFLVDARQQGKTKLIIDLSNNGGGYLGLGERLYKILFPT